MGLGLGKVFLAPAWRLVEGSTETRETCPGSIDVIWWEPVGLWHQEFQKDPGVGDSRTCYLMRHGAHGSDKKE